jgi:hypothetical protein
MIDRRLSALGVWCLMTLSTFVVATANVTGSAGAPRSDPPFDLDDRLEALDPTRPIEYLELAEEIAEGVSAGAGTERALARRLYGLAGRLDPEGLAASAALGIASLAPDARTADRYRAAASLLSPESVRTIGNRRPEIDAATAMEISEAFGEFRSGRAIALRRVLQDPARERLLRGWDEALPGGIGWLKRQVEGSGRGRPDLDRSDALAMIRVELVLLDRGRPSWSTLLAVEGDPPIVDLRPDRVPALLLDDDSASRPRYRNGAWVE